MLADHPLLVGALDDLRPAMQRNEDVKKIAALKPGQRIPWELSEAELYIDHVFRAQVGVTDIFDQLDKALFYLRSKGKSQTGKPPRYTNWTWLEYHVSYFVIMHSALFDRALILVNEVFELGNPPKQCKPEVIKSNTKVSAWTLKALAQIENCTLKLRNDRNVLLHRGYSIDIAKIFDSELLQNLKFCYAAKSLSREYVDPPFLEVALKIGKRDVITVLKKYAIEAEADTRCLLDVLLPVYVKTKRQLDAAANL